MSEVKAESKLRFIKIASLSLIIGGVAFFMIEYAVNLRQENIAEIARASQACLSIGGSVSIDAKLKYILIDYDYNCMISIRRQ